MKFLRKLHKQQKLFPVLLLVIALLFMASVVRYTERSFAYPIWDEQHYMAMATFAYREIQHATWDSYANILNVAPYRQPGYPLFMLPFLLIFGLSESYALGIITNGLFHVSSMFAVYLIARKYLKQSSSFIAAIIFLFSAWPLYFVHLTYAETATTSMVVWTVYFLLSSDFFKKRSQTLLFGLFCGLAILTKWISVVYVLGPLLYVLYHLIKNKNITKKIILNIIGAILLIGVVVGYTYYLDFAAVAQNFYDHRIGGPIWQTLPTERQGQFSWFSFTYYLFTFEKLGVYFFALFIIGTILSLQRKHKVRIMLMSILIPWIFFSFFSILKDERFIVPIYPYIAIISAMTFDIMRNSYKKILFIIITIIFALATFLGTVWGKGPLKEQFVALHLPLPTNQSIPFYLTAISRPPDIYKETGGEIIQYIVEDSQKNGITEPQVLSLFSHRQLDEPMMTYNLYQTEKPVIINNYLGTIVEPSEKGTRLFITNVMNNNDYVLVKTGQTTDTYFAKLNYTTMIALNKLFTNYFDHSKYYAKKTKIWIFQDSSTVTIFKRTNNLSAEEQKNLSQKLLKILTAASNSGINKE